MELLKDSIFSRFQETSYEVHLKGRLKANYQGHVEHIPTISQSLINRIIESPSTLWSIREILLSAAPNFSSPLYIGMSDTLGTRLRSHKALIERYRTKIDGDLLGDFEEIEKDHSFAKEVVIRQLHSELLFVCIEQIDDHFVDIENILNRINFPLFGRN